MKTPKVIQIYLFLLMYGLLNRALYAQATDFFPLAVGNEWNFTGTGMWQGFKLGMKISDTIIIHTTKYFILKTSVHPTALVRKDSAGNLFKYDSLGDRKWYDFSLQDNEKYAFIDSTWGNVDTFSVTVTTINNSVPAGTFLCKQLFFDVKTMFDEEYSRSFSDGVGMVRADYFGPSEHSALLTYAIIDGKIIGTVGVNTFSGHNETKRHHHKTGTAGKKLNLLNKEDFSRIFPVEYYDLLGRKLMPVSDKVPACSVLLFHIQKQ